MAILPVLDLMDGQIVHGIAGRRDEYRPIVSRLVDSAAPLPVARAIRAHFGFTEFYLADLNAIRDGLPAYETYRQLHDEGFRLWIDAGLRTSRDEAIPFLAENDSSVVVGLESIVSADELGRILDDLGASRVVFSLDLKEGRPLVHTDGWDTADPMEIAENAIVKRGVRRLIVLDLAHVGMATGGGTENRCMQMRKRYPEVEITTGGGVRGLADVRRLEACGVHYVLVATALHDGTFSPSVT